MHIKLLDFIQGHHVDLSRGVTNLISILQRPLWLLYKNRIQKAKTEARKIVWEATSNLDNQILKLWIWVSIHHLCFKVDYCGTMIIREGTIGIMVTRSVWLHKKSNLLLKEHLEVISSTTLTFRWRSFYSQSSYLTQLPSLNMIWVLWIIPCP